MRSKNYWTTKSLSRASRSLEGRTLKYGLQFHLYRNSNRYEPELKPTFCDRVWFGLTSNWWCLIRVNSRHCWIPKKLGFAWFLSSTRFDLDQCNEKFHRLGTVDRCLIVPVAAILITPPEPLIHANRDATFHIFMCEMSAISGDYFKDCHACHSPICIQKTRQS